VSAYDLSFAELNRTILHLVDNRQALQVVSGRPELVAAALKAFFDDNADTGNLGACLAADVQEATLSFAGRQNIVDDDDPIVRRQIPFFQNDRVVLPRV